MIDTDDTRTYNDLNQLINDGTHTLSYDPNGNLITDEETTYEWDHTNRLVEFSNSHQTVTHTYDGNNQRVQQSKGNVIPNMR